MIRTRLCIKWQYSLFVTVFLICDMVYQQTGNTTLQMFSFNRDSTQLKYLGLIDVTMILMTNQVILPLIANTKKKKVLKV